MAEPTTKVEMELTDAELDDLISFINTGVYEQSGNISPALSYKLVKGLGAFSLMFHTEVHDKAELYEATNGEA